MQVHYAYCLRAIKTGWTAEGEAQLWAWYRDGQPLGRRLQLPRLPRLHGPGSRRPPHARGAAVLLAHAAKTPFPTRVLVRGLDLNAQPDLHPDAAGAVRRALAEADNPGAADELADPDPREARPGEAPEAHAALRELAKDDPDRRDLIARALATTPTADDLPNLVAAPGFARPEHDEPGRERPARSSTPRPKAPRPCATSSAWPGGTGPSMQSALNELACRWTGGASGPRSGDFEKALAAWERSTASCSPTAPRSTTTKAGQNAYTLAAAR